MELDQIAKKFADADMQLTKDAVELIQSQPNSKATADYLLSSLLSTSERPFLVTSEMIKEILEKGTLTKVEQPVPQPPKKPKLSELSHKKFGPLAAEHEARYEVLKEITGKSYSQGQVEDFIKLFKNRFDKLSAILRSRIGLESAIALSSLRNQNERERVSLIGMVSSKRRSGQGTMFIEIEDSTGATATLVVPKNNQGLLKKAERVVLDEVIGATGVVASPFRGSIFVRDIFWPGLPYQRERRRAEIPLSAVMISDLHVGSEQFLEEVFNKFVRWLKGEEGNERERALASRVKYVVVAGDVVDGIGVYPEQKSELLIHDIYKQYEAAAELLSSIPDHIQIIVLPGNHDAVRSSEPQPAISEDIAGPLYERGFKMVGNPSLLSLEGVYFLAYHGRSFDDLIPAVPGLSRIDPTTSMIEMLERRHLAPIYGGKTPIASEPEDLMVIDEIPDVFHCGHVHRYGFKEYKGIAVVNSATFQAKTQYMQKMGIDPTPGFVPVFDLQTHEVEVMQFA